VRGILVAIMAKRASTGSARTLPGAEARILILHGKDEFLRAMHTDAVKAALAERGIDADVVRYDGASASLADILDDCRSPGLLAGHKLVVVDNAEDLVADKAGSSARPRDLLQRYAESPSDDATLILRAETWRPGNLDKAVEAVGAVIKCEAPGESDAITWASRRAEKRHGARLSPDAARTLVALTGASLGRIDAELGKLAAAAGDTKEITIALVHEFVGLSREETVWQIQDLMLRGDVGAVLAKISELITVSRQPPLLCRFALVDLARKLHAASAGMAAGVPAGVLEKELRLWGPSKFAVLDAAKRVPPAGLAVVLREAIDADVAGKTGQGDEVRGLERLVVRFASAVA
jgi:DNA polymerase-3 subunit delta